MYMLLTDVVNCRMADDELDIEAMLEAPYLNGVSY